MFTTKDVAVSEAGISSPDSSCLHLQENLERVKEIGRGATGVVFKAIHIPTLKVVAIKVYTCDIILFYFYCSADRRGNRTSLFMEKAIGDKWFENFTLCIPI